MGWGNGPIGLGGGSVVATAQNPTMVNQMAQGPPGPTPAQQLQTQQLQNAQQFRQNLPAMQGQMTGQFEQQANQGMRQGLNNVNNYNNSRGLLYGGVNQGMQQGLRAQTQHEVAQGIGGINSSLNTAANTLDAQAVQTGVGIQNTQQQIQNAIYSQAMTQMNANSSMVGSAAGFGLLAYMMP